MHARVILTEMRTIYHDPTSPFPHVISLIAIPFKLAHIQPSTRHGYIQDQNNLKTSNIYQKFPLYFSSFSLLYYSHSFTLSFHTLSPTQVISISLLCLAAQAQSFETNI